MTEEKETNENHEIEPEDVEVELCEDDQNNGNKRFVYIVDLDRLLAK